MRAATIPDLRLRRTLWQGGRLRTDLPQHHPPLRCVAAGQPRSEGAGDAKASSLETIQGGQEGLQREGWSRQSYAHGALRRKTRGTERDQSEQRVFCQFLRSLTEWMKENTRKDPDQLLGECRGPTQEKEKEENDRGKKEKENHFAHFL